MTGRFAAVLVLGGLIGHATAGTATAVPALALAVGVLVALSIVELRRAGSAAPVAVVAEPEPGWQPVAAELARARRYGRPFSVVQISSPSDADGRALAASLAPSLRRTDQAWVEGDSVILLLPESDGQAAETFARREITSLPGSCAWRIASFPVDGLTVDALRSVLAGQRTATVVPPPVAAAGPSTAADWVAERGPEVADGEPVPSQERRSGRRPLSANPAVAAEDGSMRLTS